MRSSGDSMATFLLGMAAGAVMMYITDPVAGRRRRALVRDKAISTLHDAEDTLSRTTEDLRNRASGAAAELRGRLTEKGVDDETLAARVSAELGRVSTHPRAIDVTVHNGCVTLGGDILQREADTVEDAVRKVRGVAEVRNHVRSHETPGGLPQLQGEGRVAD